MNQHKNVSNPKVTTMCIKSTVLGAFYGQIANRLGSTPIKLGIKAVGKAFTA